MQKEWAKSICFNMTVDQVLATQPLLHAILVNLGVKQFSFLQRYFHVFQVLPPAFWSWKKKRKEKKKSLIFQELWRCRQLCRHSTTWERRKQEGSRFPKEVVDATSLEASKATAGGLRLDDLWGPFQPRPFYDSIISNSCVFKEKMWRRLSSSGGKNAQPRWLARSMQCEVQTASLDQLISFTPSEGCSLTSNFCCALLF